MNSNDLFNAIKSSHIKFSKAKNKQNEFLNKLRNIYVGKKLQKKKKRLIISKK